MTPPRWSRDQSSRATPREAHRPPWACRESFRKLAVRRVAASPESIGGEGEELVPNAALLHNDTMCVFPAVPETGKRRKVGRPAGALPGRQDWPHRREKDGCPAGAPPGWCGRGGETRRRGTDRRSRRRGENPVMTAAGLPGPARAERRGRLGPGTIGGTSDRDWRLAVGVPGGGAGAAPARDGGEKAVLQRNCLNKKIGWLRLQEGRSHAPRIDLGHGPDRRAGETITATRCGDELMHSSSRPKRETPDPRKKGNCAVIECNKANSYEIVK